MSITKVEFKNRKAHLRYDPVKKVYVGYQIDVRAGKRRYRDTFKTRGDAQRFIDALKSAAPYRKAGLKVESSNAPLLSKLFAVRLLKIENPKEKIRAIRVFEYFRRLLDHDPLVTAIRTAHFQLYINKRTEDGVKNETIYRELNTIGSAFHGAAAMFPLELEDYEPPKIARPRVNKGKRQRHEITETEMNAIVKNILELRMEHERPVRTASRPVIAKVFELAWLLGLRSSELKKLPKVRFNKNERTLLVYRPKTNTFNLLEFLPDRVIELLDNDPDTEFIFNIPCSDHTFESIVREACVGAGLVYGRGKADGVTFHSTRHAFTSRLVRVTDIATAGEFTGHSTDEMVDYYSQPSRESKRLAMERMYGNGKKITPAEVFAKIKSGEIDLDAFLAQLA